MSAFGSVASASTVVTNHSQLQNAINNAPADGTLHHITITDSFILEGTISIADGRNILLSSQSGRHTLYAPQEGRHFRVLGENTHLTLENITLDGGNRGDDFRGGIIVEQGGKLTLGSGSLVQNNHSNAYGGGVEVLRFSHLTIAGGVVRDNTTSLNGGGIWMTNSGMFYMAAGEISNNHSNAHGGALRLSSRVGDPADSIGTGSFVITGGSILGNTANRNGGGFSLNHPQMTVELAGQTLFRGNVSTGDGGAIHSNAKEYLQLTETTVFYGNSASVSSLPPTNLSLWANIQTTARTTSLGEQTWLLNNYDINFLFEGFVLRFYLQGGHVNGVSTVQTYHFDIGTRPNMSPPTPERQGYVFLGWGSSPDGVVIDPLDLSSIEVDSSFYARWQEVQGRIQGVKFALDN